jgi:hypothetical protein
MSTADPQPDKFGVTETSKQPVSAPLAPVVLVFRQRAARLRLTAVVILGIICALLAGGAVVFVVAPQLTVTDLYPLDLDKKIADVEQEIARTRTEAQPLEAVRITWQRSAYAFYRPIFDDFATKHGKLGFPAERLEGWFVYGFRYDYLDPREFANKIRNDVTYLKGEDYLIGLTVYGRYEPLSTYTIPLAKIDDFAELLAQFPPKACVASRRLPQVRKIKAVGFGTGATA